MWIRANGQTKRDTLVVDFKTRGQRQGNRIVAALDDLYDGQPVGSVAIGEAVQMEHRQVLKYLHEVKDDGRVKPVLSSANGIIRGWVPAHVEVPESLAEQKARRAASAVRELQVDGGLVTANAVARHLRVPVGTIGRWLKVAESMRLVQSEPRRGWKPA